MVGEREDFNIRVSYNETEFVRDGVGAIRHDTVREALRWAGIEGGIEIVSMAGLPAKAGLGSSGAFAAALVQAILVRRNSFYSPNVVTGLVNYLEIDRCKKPCGYQDQTASAFGGIAWYRFHGQDFSRDDLSAGNVQDLFERLLLVDVSAYGPSNKILRRQAERVSTGVGRSDTQAMANLAGAFRDAFLSGDLDECGEIVDASWSLKKSFDSEMSNELYDQLLVFSKRRGAIGGKLCGAGGRGMFLLFCSEGEREHIAEEVGHLLAFRTISPQFCPLGTQTLWADSSWALHA
jgi:D-glycero-alpha-D-manno-heptose-7-phosphate kinase